MGIFLKDNVFGSWSSSLLPFIPARDSEDELGELLAKKNDAVYSYLKKFMCFNQGAFIEYHYRLSETHRALKHDLEHTTMPASQLKTRADELVLNTDKSLARIVSANFDILHAHFHKRGQSRPRICVKFHFEEESDSEGTLAPIFRDKPETEYRSLYRSSASTAFKSVMANGSWYLDNDIPLATEKPDYVNPRIDVDKARAWSKYYGEEIRRSGQLPSLIAAQAEKEWRACWNYGGSSSSFYKSTLIIPITFWNNNFSDEFIKLIEERIPHFKETIFGFLCFDSNEIGYFNDQSDVALGYMASDWLSLYIFMRIRYVHLSRTMESINNLEPGIDPRIREDRYNDEIMASELVSSLWKKTKRKKRDAKRGEVRLYAMDEQFRTNLLPVSE